MSTERANRAGLGHAILASSQQAVEADLIELAKTDSHAFGELYEAHYGTVLNYIYRQTLNITVAEELTSNTFFKALQALPSYRHRAPFRAWLYRIATNELRMHWRSERKRREKEDDPRWKHELERLYFSVPEVESEEERREKVRAYARLHECLNELSERYRIVLVLRYFEELTYKEVSRVLGKKVGTVKALVHRGLKKMQALMHDEDATFSPESHYHE